MRYLVHVDAGWMFFCSCGALRDMEVEVGERDPQSFFVGFLGL